ncbi:MAG: cytochrome C554 [Calditrichaeota bacterium]|nr:MAG: cytochrome C554 [Calditrichota bacterium]
MKRVNVILLVLTFLFILVGSALPQNKKTFTYVGVKGCKACHLTKKSGAQFKIWKKSPHAKAYETLATPKAKEIAKKYDIDDPQKSEKCLKCHVTAFGVDEKIRGKKLTLAEGVSCEACHGPGSGYKTKKVMQAIWEGKVDGAKYGLIKPDEKVCVRCHNEESPTFKSFDFEKMKEKIAHPVPKKKK